MYLGKRNKSKPGDGPLLLRITHGFPISLAHFLVWCLILVVNLTHWEEGNSVEKLSQSDGTVVLFMRQFLSLQRSCEDWNHCGLSHPQTGRPGLCKKGSQVASLHVFSFGSYWSSCLVDWGWGYKPRTSLPHSFLFISVLSQQPRDKQLQNKMCCLLEYHGSRPGDKFGPGIDNNQSLTGILLGDFHWWGLIFFYFYL